MNQLIAPVCHFFPKINVILCVSKLTLVLLLSIAAPTAFSADTDAKDSDGDGLSDTYEEEIGTEAYLSDTDGDGIKDGVEVGDNLKEPLNSDNDTRIDALDYDDDNDGLPTFLESKKDTDKDGVKDYLDTDSDNDGLVDGKEAGALNIDVNLDGIDDGFDTGRKGAVDKNGDGIDDNVKLPDHNNDGIADYLDATFKKQETVVLPLFYKGKKTADSTEDKEATKKLADEELLVKDLSSKDLSSKKITSNTQELGKSAKTKPKAIKLKVVEKSSGNTITKPSVKQKVQVNRYTDTDNDGLLDSQEVVLGTNIMKRDSDGDKVSDAVEIGMDINSPQDSDRDGIIDALDNDDDNDGILTRDEDINKDSTAINDDTDQDGVPNYLDANDDGDERLTKDEGGTKDSDQDGILDYLDKNDGVKDKRPETVDKEKIPDEPEVVVLFDGNMSSLPKENMSAVSDEGAAEQAIENAVVKGSLDKENTAAKTASENKNSASANVVSNDEMSKAVIKKKEKVGIIQWLTSLLPD